MKILVSPTKTMASDRTPAGLFPELGRPGFAPEADTLIRELQPLDFGTLKKLFKTSERLTQKIQDQIRGFNLADPKPALFVFQGEAFKAMNPQKFTLDQLEYANDTLHILSGLYGVLRAKDGIKPYRLDFNTTLSMGLVKHFWQEKIVSYFKNQVPQNEIILNLASNEYSCVLKCSPLGDRIITLHFLERENGNLKNLSVRAKQARGLFAGEIIRKKLTDVRDVKKIILSDYEYTKDLSSRTEWFFVR
ncbi:MAG: YaaA family protein [Proteobacteria bacterium]|nr:YaaA family protein [Pseudomonadota bacterium]